MMRKRYLVAIGACIFILIIAGAVYFHNRPALVEPVRQEAVKKPVLKPGQKEVFEKNKHIYYFDGKTQVQLTKIGSNHDPVLSPDGRKVLFTRKSDQKAVIPSEGDGFADPETGLSDQLWIMDIKSLDKKLLVSELPWPKERQDIETEKLFPWIGEAQFSLDGKSVYFLVPVWMTSSALYVVPSNGEGVARYIISSNYLEVIERGEYKGNLILSQHRYFLYGGSYDWCYIYTPEGKEVAVLSEDPEQIDWERLYAEDAANQKEKVQ
jgi:dipeptidyl aminopeptidase/acylaminoacyl peptidase